MIAIAFGIIAAVGVIALLRIGDILERFEQYLKEKE